jgi:hypothetical protein
MHYIVDLGLRQRQRLHVLVEPGVRDAIALVVMIHHTPQRLHRPGINAGRSGTFLSADPGSPFPILAAFALHSQAVRIADFDQTGHGPDR